MTTRPKSFLTAHEAINLLAFGQASAADQTGIVELEEKCRVGWGLQPSPELLQWSLQEYVRVKKDLSPSENGTSIFEGGFLAWAHAAVEYFQIAPGELLAKLDFSLLQITERRCLYRGAERRLVALLRDGEITAIATPAQPYEHFPGPDPGRLQPIGTAQKIEQSAWHTPGIGIWPNGDVREAPGLVPSPQPWFGPLFVEMRLPRAEVNRFRLSDSALRVLTSNGVETRLLKWLISRMRQSPERSPGKKQIRSEAAANGHETGPRQFERAWRRAVEDAPAPNWSTAGRKSTQG